MKIVLFYPKLNEIKETENDIILDNIYNELAIIPSSKQLKTYNKLDKLLLINSVNNIDDLINLFKQNISKLSNKVPLFDYNTKNIYLIDRNDVYQKVTMYNYRFPNTKIINLLKSTLDDLNIAFTKTKADWINKYIKKINKNLNFLANFDFNTLKQTYYDALIDSNPSTKDLTTCIRPSYLPYQKSYQTPYYTKSELVSMGLNLNIISNNSSNSSKILKPWSYSKSELENICKELSKYEINTQMLIYNQLYILYNNAKSYVQYYSLFGSYYINSYLRNKNSIYDSDMNNHIDNFFKLMKSTPAFDNTYEVYRFIENDDYLTHLKIGDIFNENSFISTTRNPFYSEKKNVFGFILLKISLPKNIHGIALLMESYSNYPYEQEVLLAPGKLKLIETNNDFKYYHWNKLAEKKIIKKYVFEYIEPLSYDINYYIKNYIKPTQTNIIPDIDFYKITYEGSNIGEKVINFFNSLYKINLRRTFNSKIGDKKYNFFAYFLSQSKVYSKFFFLQKEDEQNKMLGDEIYLSVQNETNGQIELLIEIRNIISVNYYHRYSGLSNTIPENDLLHWLAGLAKSLSIHNIIIHGNYSSYAHIIENILSKSNIEQTNILEDFKTIQNIDNPDANILNLYTADVNTYCLDLIEYIFWEKKRFSNQMYIERKVPLFMIDKLKKITFLELYTKYGLSEIEGNNQLYKIYLKEIKNQHQHQQQQQKDLTVLEFYKLIHNFYPYLINRLQNLIIYLYPQNITISPWHFYYVFKPYQYLFENQLISFIPETDIEKVDQMIKNLADEVKFIHENKFRQIL